MLLYNAYIYLSGMQNKKLCQLMFWRRSILYGDMHIYAISLQKKFVKIKIEPQLKT